MNFETFYTRLRAAVTVMLWMPIWLLMWAVQIFFKLLVAIPGVFIIPFLYRYRFTDIDNLPLWAILWANPEDWHGGHRNYDGSIPTWWMKRERKPGVPWGDSRYSFWRYHARRNPADGLRNIGWLQLWIDMDKVRYLTPKYFDHYEPWSDRTPGWRFYIAWQGPYMGMKLQWVREKSYSESKLGFRVEPRDAHHPLAENSARRHLGASFASSFRPYRDL